MMALLRVDTPDEQYHAGLISCQRACPVHTDAQLAIPTVVADADEMAALLRSCLDGRVVMAGGQRVAIIGARPAGLSAAHDLALSDSGRSSSKAGADPAASGRVPPLARSAGVFSADAADRGP